MVQSSDFHFLCYCLHVRPLVLMSLRVLLGGLLHFLHCFCPSFCLDCQLFGSTFFEQMAESILNQLRNAAARRVAKPLAISTNRSVATAAPIGPSPSPPPPPTPTSLGSDSGYDMVRSGDSSSGGRNHDHRHGSDRKHQQQQQQQGYSPTSDDDDDENGHHGQLMPVAMQRGHRSAELVLMGSSSATTITGRRSHHPSHAHAHAASDSAEVRRLRAQIATLERQIRDLNDQNGARFANLQATNTLLMNTNVRLESEIETLRREKAALEVKVFSPLSGIC